MSSRTATTASTTTQGSVAAKPQPSQQTTPQTQPAQGSQMHEKIAMRAYQKWVQRGCPHGTDKQDWLEAEAEVKSEGNRPAGSAAAQPQQRR